MITLSEKAVPDCANATAVAVADDSFLMAYSLQCCGEAETLHFGE